MKVIPIHSEKKTDLSNILRFIPGEHEDLVIRPSTGEWMFVEKGVDIADEKYEELGFPVGHIPLDPYGDTTRTLADALDSHWPKLESQKKNSESPLDTLILKLRT